MSRYFLVLILVTSAAGEPIGFNSHIRPLLSDHCFACHGFDPSSREADLRLDTPEGAFADRKSGPGIVPGEPENSLIWKRIITKDLDDVMPPADHLLKLDADEKKLIYRWIKEGAKYEEHWTFIPVKSPTVPDLSSHPVDALVKHKLRSLKMDLSPRASKETLIRRLSFDLRGLPPTPKEVEAFLSNNSPEAWEQLVDQFLADKAFGERFAWPWLDAARYADSNGFQGDRERTMWPWRDWVIDAINRNLPYDDFTVWQIAGDLLPNATFEQKLATGFLRNHAINGEGGSIPEENRVNYVFDMAETVGTVWMGLTFNCCRCHDHKYDPLSQKDYYSLTAFFNQTPVGGGGGDPQTKPVLPVPGKEQKERDQQLTATISNLEKKLTTLAQAVTEPGKQTAWEKTVRAGGSQSWKILPMANFQADNTSFDLLPDQSSLIEKGRYPLRSDYNITLKPEPGAISALRLETMRHPNMTKGRLAPSDSGNFVLTNITIHLVDTDGKKQLIPIASAEATYEQPGWPVTDTFDKSNKTGWAVWNGNDIDRDHAALFRFKKPQNIGPNERLHVTLSHKSDHLKHVIGRFRLAVSPQSPPPLNNEDQTLLTALNVPANKRNKDQKALIRGEFLKSFPDYTTTEKDLADRRLDLENLRKSTPKVMVMEDRKERRETYVLAVGSYAARGEVVEAATPGILPTLSSDKPLNRLDLARWLIARNNPLTSRVTVNRLWQELFGIGLIKSPEDLGVQSEIPVHPDLLDWLSADFMDSGWDFKNLIKTIVTSEVYQQSSKVDSLVLERDPDNRLLARAPRYRLPSWMIRDQALALSGRLVPKIGGAPVKPYQPAGLWSEATFGKKKYVPDTGEAVRRRTIYTFWRRISAPAMIFDNAKRENCEVGAYHTNSPLHALATLNDPLYTESARDLVSRCSAIGRTSEQILVRVFQSINARPPSQSELQIIMELYQNSLTYFSENNDAGRKLLGFGEPPLKKGGDMIIDAALTTTTLSLLNTDEALTKE